MKLMQSPRYSAPQGNPWNAEEAKATAQRMILLHGSREAIARCERHIASRSSVPSEFWREVARIIAAS